MLVSCKICHREYVASLKANKEHFVCSKCQVRKCDPGTGLGLHPALERKWAQQKNDRYSSDSPRVTVGPKPQTRPKLSDVTSLPKIPGFEISYQVGKGAMGSVYRARQVKTGQMVAIKILSYDLSERADLVARFEREAYVLKSLSNPNVVSIIDAGRVNGTHYLVMEFIDGITLRTRINQGPIDIAESRFILCQILNGLIAAHRHGIVHRDLKPENVLLFYGEQNFSEVPTRVVLVDFGLVGIGGSFDPHPNLTRSRVTMGTVNYMAPEQHIDAKRVDHRSDLYSAGVIFFEMLTQELPLGRYLLPSERGMNLPLAVDQILSMALSRQVEERYVSAEEFLNDLGKLSLNQQPPVKSDKAKISTTKPYELVWDLTKASFLKRRYAWLLLMASLFFAFGIKMSLGQVNDASIKAKDALGPRPATASKR